MVVASHLFIINVQFLVFLHFLLLFFTAELKENIRQAFLKINETPKWNDELAKFSVWGFKSIDISLYENELLVREVVKDQRIKSAYY